MSYGLSTRSPGPRPCTGRSCAGPRAPPSGPLEVPRPDAAQHRDRGQRGEALWRAVPRHRLKQAVAVLADLSRVGLPLGPGLGQPRVLDPAAVALEPVRRRERAQPVRLHRRDGVQGRTQRLGHQLDPVEVAHGGEHVRGVGALPAARLEQAERPCGVQHAREQALAGIGGEETAAELAEHAVVEAGVAEFEAEQVLPVDPAPDRLGGPPVAQPLAELQQGDQREPPRRAGRLAALRVEVGEVAVREDGPEPVAKGEVGIAGRKGCPRDAGGRVGDGRDGALRAERHGLPPRGLVSLRSPLPPHSPIRQQCPSDLPPTPHSSRRSFPVNVVFASNLYAFPLKFYMYFLRTP